MTEALKAALRRIPGARSGVRQYRLLSAIARERFLANPGAECDLSHIRRQWDFSSPAEQERFRRVLHAMEALRPGPDWGDVLEAACSEGHFTLELGRRSRSVEAWDISPVACARAKERCAQAPNVTIRNLDLLGAPAAGEFDVVFLMCVLEYFYGRDQHRRVLENICSAIKPGGLLVFNSTRLPARDEQSWWARWLVQGAVQQSAFLAKRADLRQLSHEVHTDYVVAVFGKLDRHEG